MPRNSFSKTSFHFLEACSLQNRTKLKAFITTIFRREGRKLNSLNVIFCSDDYLLGINQQFLGHQDFTDIITFDLSDEEASAAEIYISVNRVRENASTFGTTFRQELLRVIFHGVLHLCGYKDKTKTHIKAMREKEQFYLMFYGRS